MRGMPDSSACVSCFCMLGAAAMTYSALIPAAQSAAEIACATHNHGRSASADTAEIRSASADIAVEIRSAGRRTPLRCGAFCAVWLPACRQPVLYPSGRLLIRMHARKKNSYKNSTAYLLFLIELKTHARPRGFRRRHGFGALGSGGEGQYHALFGQA